jgi:hypothetical protein
MSRISKLQTPFLFEGAVEQLPAHLVNPQVEEAAKLRMPQAVPHLT